MKVINIVGARPNFMKIAPVMEAYRAHPSIVPLLLHTGQHYDEAMSKLFFDELEIPRPDINLEVGSASHAAQTAAIMQAFEPVVMEHKPDAVLVVGDVNSTIACGLVAVKLGAKLIHVEAGLRSFDRTMPEEVNRVLTDAISDFLFCTEQSGVDNLAKEGVDAGKVHLVGNVMIDTLMRHRAKADESPMLKRLKLKPREFAVLTLHRPANVDDPAIFSGILDALEEVQKQMPVIFPIHPRSRKGLVSSGLDKRVAAMKNLQVLYPLGYLDFLKLMSEAKLVLTDSGGIQEETTILKVPCVTLRENTERPITVECGANTVVGRDPKAILSACNAILKGSARDIRTPPLWDGHAAERIVEIIARAFA